MIDDLKILKRLIDQAIEAEEIGLMVNMSDVEKQRFQTQFPDTIAILGNYQIKQVQRFDPGW